MTDHPAPSSPVSRWTVARRVAFRCVAGAAVVLGACCLWLALASVRQPVEAEALDDWDEQSAEPRLVQAAKDSKPISAELTDVIETNAVIPAVQEEDADSSAKTVEQIGHVQQPAPSSAGAWLTGGIEDVDAEADMPRALESQIPAWRRTTRSMKSALKASARSSERR